MWYRGGAREAYIVRPVDDLTLVYHRPSGTTHVAAPIVVALLDALYERDLDIDAVVDTLLRNHDFEESRADVAKTIAIRLEELAEIGLVDRLT